MRLKPTHLEDANFNSRGKYAVGQLVADFAQSDLAVIPKGTRFRLGVSNMTGQYVAMFPFESLPDEMRVFSDAHIRIVEPCHFEVVGRIN